MLEYRLRGMYERECIHAECKEKNLRNENACKSYTYRKMTVLKSMLRKNMSSCGWVFPTHIVNNDCQLCELYRKFGFYK